MRISKFAGKQKKISGNLSQKIQKTSSFRSNLIFKTNHFKNKHNINNNINHFTTKKQNPNIFFKQKITPTFNIPQKLVFTHKYQFFSGFRTNVTIKKTITPFCLSTQLSVISPLTFSNPRSSFHITNFLNRNIDKTTWFEPFPNIEVPKYEKIDVFQSDPDHLQKQVHNKLHSLAQTRYVAGVTRQPKWHRKKFQVLRKVFERSGKEFPNIRLYGDKDGRSPDEDFPPRDTRNNPKGRRRVKERELRQQKILENMKKMPKMIEDYHRKEREERAKKRLVWPNVWFAQRQRAKPHPTRKGPTPIQQMVSAKKYLKLDRLLKKEEQKKKIEEKKKKKEVKQKTYEEQEK